MRAVIDLTLSLNHPHLAAGGGERKSGKEGPSVVRGLS